VNDHLWVMPSGLPGASSATAVSATSIAGTVTVLRVEGSRPDWTPHPPKKALMEIGEQGPIHATPVGVYSDRGRDPPDVARAVALEVPEFALAFVVVGLFVVAYRLARRQLRLSRARAP
jgi:hypothetical protein